jgi:hypothetical protein
LNLNQSVIGYTISGVDVPAQTTVVSQSGTMINLSNPATGTDPASVGDPNPTYLLSIPTKTILTSGATTSGSNAISLAIPPNPSPSLIGLTVAGAGIPVSTTVLTQSASTLVLSNEATVTASGVNFFFSTPDIPAIGATTNGSDLITLAAALSPSPSVVGFTVTGSGIPNATTVVSQTGTMLQLSNQATSTGSGVSVVFSVPSLIMVSVSPGSPITQGFHGSIQDTSGAPDPNNQDLSATDGVESKAIHVISDAPISVYGFLYIAEASDGYLALPTSRLGRNYVILSRSPDIYINSAASPITQNNAASEFIVVATRNNTQVNIKPSIDVTDPTTGNVLAAGMMYTRYLNQGDAYELQAVVTSSSVQPDLTGTAICANANVAVLAGDSIADVYASGFVFETGTANMLVEQLPSTDRWQPRAVGAGFAGRTSGSIYRILTNSNAHVTANGQDISSAFIPISTIQSITDPLTGTQVPSTISISEELYNVPVYFASDQPILVAEYAQGQQTDSNGDEADPTMILLPDPSQYLSGYTFISPTQAEFTQSFVNLYLVNTTAAINSVSVDSMAPVRPTITSIAGTAFTTMQISLSGSGAHAISSSVPVGVSVYGYGNFDNYGFNAGLNFPTLQAIPDYYNLPVSGGLVYLNVVDNDTIAGNPSSITIASLPVKGGASFTNYGILYRPNVNASPGQDSFVYQLIDSNQNTSSTTVLVNLSSGMASAVSPTETLSSGQTFTFNVNVNRGPSPSVYLLGVSQPTSPEGQTVHGRIVLTPGLNGTIQYTAPAGAGSDTYYYRSIEPAGVCFGRFANWP